MMRAAQSPRCRIDSGDLRAWSGIVRRGSDASGRAALRVERGLWTRAAVFEPLAVFGTGAAVVILFTLSPIFLEAHGYAYETSGGSAISKVHPATIIAIMALGLRFLASHRPMRTAWRIITRDRCVVLYVAVLASVCGFAIIVTKTPFTPLIDTLFLPLVFLLLLRDLDEQALRALALLLAAILAINACVALAEFLFGWRLVTIPVPDNTTSDPTRADGHFDWRAQLMQEWRATALLGHPLQNGVIIGSFVICLASAGSRWLPDALRFPLLILQITSMFAFGARTSLVLSFALVAIIGAFRLAIMAIERPKIDLRALALICLVAPFALAALTYVWNLGFFDRTIDRFLNDAGSANTRFTMFEMFKPLSWNDLFFGPNPLDVATWQRVLGLEFGIESSWVGLILIYGIFMSLLFVAGIVSFSLSLVRAAGRGATLVLFFYLAVVSTAATLSGKTTTLAMVTILVLLFLRRDERRSKLPQLFRAIIHKTPDSQAGASFGIKPW
jgi:hypothetical protein